MVVLRGVSKEIDGQVFELTKSETTVGRHESNDIVLDHLSVSAFHCCITKDGELYTLRDLDSTNGTRVNNQQITMRVLAAGSCVQVGGLDLVLESETGGLETEKPAAEPKPMAASAAPVQRSGAGGSHEGFQTAGRLKGKTIWIVVGVAGVLGLIGVVMLAVILLRLG